jgi:hypothetical protein
MMGVYRGVVPRVAKAIVSVLRGQKALKIDPSREDRLELAIAAALVDALGGAMAPPGAPPPPLDRLAQGVSQAVTRSVSVDAVFADQATLVRLVLPVLETYQRVDAKLDAQLREELTGHSEGTPEWETAYGEALRRHLATRR